MIIPSGGAGGGEVIGSPSRILITTWGSRGDFQPYLALAQALIRRGHDVVLAASDVPEYAAATKELGVRFEGIGQPVDIPAFLDVGFRVHRTRDPLKQVRVILDELLLPGLEDAYRRCVELGREADVIVSHCLQPAGRMAAETLGKPMISGTLVPLQIPSRHQPPRKMPNLGMAGNRLLWRITGMAIDMSWARAINGIRQRVGLPPVRNLAGDTFYAPKLNLVAASRHVSPPPRDWAPRHLVTGYWFVDREEYSAPQYVEQFLEESGAPVVAIGFGSMALPGTRELTRLVVESVQRAGVRAVIDGGWAGLGDGDLPEGIVRADDVPHAWLLPRVSAFAYHSGSGTSAAAFRAGVPSIPIPHIFDHEYWAERAWRLGVATRPVPRKRLTVDALAAAMREAVASREMRARSAQLAQRIKEEDGVRTAAGLIESFAESAAASPSWQPTALASSARPASQPAGVEVWN